MIRSNFAMVLATAAAIALTSVFTSTAKAQALATPTTYWMKVKAKDKFERTLVSNTGVSIEVVKDDYVIAFGHQEQLDALKKMNRIETSFVFTDKMDFPAKDANFHNYAEIKAEVESLAARFPEISKLDSIGKSTEGRELFRLRISGDINHADDKPAVVFMGGHHAREHLSIEIPLLLAKYLLENYATDEQIKRLVDGRDIHIIPVVNPDGAEFDISTGTYKFWRKNRAVNSDGSAGVDLNRNYGYEWNTGGSSDSMSNETYHGPTPFSEPETQAVKNFIDNQKNLTTLLTFHTFSELILYPWGHTYDSVPNARDQKVFETMAQTMSKWNKYKAEQTSDLYVASGDTTDWAYGTHGIFAFTFELDPADMWSSGGFYPGQAVIPAVFQKNLKPALYLIEYADSPYRVLEPASQNYGLTSPLVN